jgi:hypothetical protein
MGRFICKGFTAIPIMRHWPPACTIGDRLRRTAHSLFPVDSYTFKAVITVIVTGLVGAVWLGVKVMLGK